MTDRKSYGSSNTLMLTLIATSVLITGILAIASILLAQARPARVGIVTADASVTLLVGLTFIYLASLLRRGKYAAWVVAIPLYVYIVIRNINHFLFDLPRQMTITRPLPVLLNLIIPAIALGGLLLGRNLFTVRSQLRNFSVGVRRALFVLCVALLYGVIGFQVFDIHDFHKEIPLTSGVHYTIDQFGLTTNDYPKPYTGRASLFLDSLSVISIGALFYVAVSLFAPIRFRLSAQQREYDNMLRLLKKYPGDSEAFFKLWPRDKAYFINQTGSAGLAYRVSGRSALVLGDPAGLRSDFTQLLEEFTQYCRVNDWRPAFIHIEHTYAKLYRQAGLELQKIGEEAVVDIDYFIETVKPNKYFRHIANRFKKEGYTTGLLMPPHSGAVLGQLKKVSDDWLKVPGRAERTFTMGYFTEVYMQRCPIMVARDEKHKIKAFLNQVPSFDPYEANIDFLRHAQGSPGNINDFLLLGYIDELHQQHIARLNLGLCPLAGLAAGNDGERTALDGMLKFVYANGNRFYSFKGLLRFKSKYEPEWRSRFIAYSGGLRGFSRTLNALVRAMRIHPAKEKLHKTL